MGETTAIVLSNYRALIVIDAPDEVQQWADAFTTLARSGPRDWPGPAHLDLPTRVITLAALWGIVNASFSTSDGNWSVARSGLPRLVLPGGSTFGSSHRPGKGTHRNTGSMWHNALHACLGDFHS
jgi:hypothetical protein